MAGMQDAVTPIFVCPAPEPPVARRRVEICEHKGIGHPDTITDAVCEAIGCELAQTYRRQFDRVLHFNVDKGLLVAGRSEPRFGGGSLIAPAKLIVCGRAANPGGTLNVSALAIAAAERWLAAHIRALPGQFSVVPEIEEGSSNLQQVYVAGRRVALANDTSFGVGFAPRSMLERRVSALAETLSSDAFRSRFPAAGDDFKIMGLRTDERYAFTIAIAAIGRHLADAGEYFAMKREMHRHLTESLQCDCTMVINALDDPAEQSESGVYLTVTGLSAEMGDDGQVGRGNRVSGLITPGRPMSLEAAAGKNPVAHVGKIYNVLAQRLAGEIVSAMPQVEEANVKLVSMIGRPIDQPQAVMVEIAIEGGLTSRIKEQVSALVGAQLSRITELTGALERGDIPVY